MRNEQVEKDLSLKSVGGTGPAKTGQTANTSIKPGLMVHAIGTGEMGGAAGKHVGTVDHIDGDSYIKLTKEDFADKQHRWIPTSWVAKTDDKAVYLNKTEIEFQAGACKSCPDELLNKAV